MPVSGVGDVPVMPGSVIGDVPVMPGSGVGDVPVMSGSGVGDAPVMRLSLRVGSARGELEARAGTRAPWEGLHTRFGTIAGTITPIARSHVPPVGKADALAPRSSQEGFRVARAGHPQAGLSEVSITERPAVRIGTIAGAVGVGRRW